MLVATGSANTHISSKTLFFKSRNCGRPSSAPPRHDDNQDNRGVSKDKKNALLLFCCSLAFCHV